MYHQASRFLTRSLRVSSHSRGLCPRYSLPTTNTSRFSGFKCYSSFARVEPPQSGKENTIQYASTRNWSSIACKRPSDIPQVPVYTISLDEPPEKRWEHVMHDYKDKFASVIEDIDNVLRNFGLTSTWERFLSGAMAGITHLGLVKYGNELKSISKQSGISLGKLALMQLVYEACACCTSIVVPNADGIPLHIRTMDWAFPFLGPLTVEYHFVKNGEKVFSATSWIGYVGILTGMRPGGYSVSVNFRNTGTSPMENLKAALRSFWPIGFLLREVLETTQNYDLAVRHLAESKLIAPCYFTICGTSDSSSKGTLLTRRRDAEEQRWTIQEHGPIIQTNMDHWSNHMNESIMNSIQRRTKANSLLEEAQTKNEATLWKVMSAPPILNSVTIYGTFMCPEIGVLHSRMPGKGNVGFRSQSTPEFLTEENLKEYLVNPPQTVI